MIGKLICWWTKKHKRGKRVTASPDGLIEPGALKHQTYECPRCAARWTRKAKA